MEGTLYGNLRELDTLRPILDKYEFGLPEEEVTSARTEVIRGFYGKNALAGVVSNGKGSYSDMAKAIRKKYGTFWRRFSAPEIDEGFDAETEVAIASMNGVGICLATSSDYFTTRKMKKRINRSNWLSLEFGAGAGILFTLLTDLNPNTYADSLMVGSAAFLGVTAAYRAFMDNIIRQRLNLLQSDAENTDEFLRQNTV